MAAEHDPDLRTHTFVRGATAPRPIGALVRVVGEKMPTITYRLKEGVCTIGSSSSADVVIPDRTVSRKHVELELIPEGVRVRDLGSHNGSFYMGQRIETIVLGLGASITVGATRVTIDADTEPLQGMLSAADSFRGMVGTSVAMRRLFALLERLEGSLVTVLIGGESGVGKELVAHALHSGSQLAKGPLVIVNCGAIPRDLVGSELFGHKRGAFTGAVDARRGAFESADGGTLFLDEIGELPLDVQPMLLRALEAGEVRPIGGDQSKQVHVRVITATNRDLEEEVRLGRFREDLYYRLAVIKLQIPPLRERPEDIEPLAKKFATSAGLTELAPQVLEQLKSRSWPGNARELRNVVQAYAALGTLPAALGPNAAALDLALGDIIDIKRPYSDQKDEIADRFTRIYLQALLAHTQGNQTAASKLAGLDRTYLGRLLVKHGLSRGT